MATEKLCESCGASSRKVGILFRTQGGFLCKTCRHKVKWNGKTVDISPAEDWKFS